MIPISSTTTESHAMLVDVSSETPVSMSAMLKSAKTKLGDSISSGSGVKNASSAVETGGVGDLLHGMHVPPPVPEALMGERIALQDHPTFSRYFKMLKVS